MICSNSFIKKTFYVLSFAFLLFFVFTPNPVDAHKQFRDLIEERYSMHRVKVHCNACHVKGQRREDINSFGTLFREQAAFKEGDFSNRITALLAAGSGEEELDELKREMLSVFQDALIDVEKRNAKDGQTYADLIRSKELPYISEKGR